MQSNPEYGQWCQSRPKRIEIPLDAPSLSKVETHLIADVGVEAPMINYKLCNGTLFVTISNFNILFISYYQAAIVLYNGYSISTYFTK